MNKGRKEERKEVNQVWRSLLTIPTLSEGV